jgi:membrane-bound metal-dependent hydrolase YbcI (DUF457 family)
MPVTPFHFGPGLLLRAAAPRHFSLTAFVATNVAIDLESGYFLFTGGWPVHRSLHTFLLATLVGLAVGWLVHRIRRRELRAALAGGVVGGLSHALMDGIMHADMNPLRPFADGNPFLLATSLATLHLFCVASGAIGMLWLVAREGDRPPSA